MLKRSIVITGLSLLIGTAWAAPDQIDVIGIVPGVTTVGQFKSLCQEEKCEIGGKKLFCTARKDLKTPYYVELPDDEVVHVFYCFFGSEFAHVGTNNEIFLILEKGFREKFGPPANVKVNKVTNKLGTEFSQKSVTWTDRQGNQLEIKNMSSKIDTGDLSLISAKYLKELQIQQQIIEQNRKF
jgi:hypothetical protein